MMNQLQVFLLSSKAYDRYSTLQTKKKGNKKIFNKTADRSREREREREIANFSSYKNKNKNKTKQD